MLRLLGRCGSGQATAAAAAAGGGGGDDDNKDDNARVITVITTMIMTMMQVTCSVNVKNVLCFLSSYVLLLKHAAQN